MCVLEKGEREESYANLVLVLVVVVVVVMLGGVGVELGWDEGAEGCEEGRWVGIVVEFEEEGWEGGFYRIFAKKGLSADDSDFLTSRAFWKAFQNLLKPRRRTKERKKESRVSSSFRFASRPLSLFLPSFPPCFNYPRNRTHLSVSSPAPVQIVCPSGLIAR